MDASPEISEEDIPIDYAKVRKTIGVFFPKRYGISAQPDSDDPLSSTSEPELDPVSPEEWCISGEPEPVSSEGLVDDISDAISELKSQMLVSEDLTDSEEVEGSSSKNNQSSTDVSPETAEEDIPTSASTPKPTSEPLSSTLGPMEPELDLVNPEECYIPGSSSFEVEPVSSEGLVDDISDTISELKSQMLVSEDLTDPERLSVEVGGSSSENDQSGTDASPETTEEDIPTDSTKVRKINKINKVLVHCCDGVSHSPMLLLAYLMIHRDMNVEEAIDHVTKMRHIKPSVNFLTQLMSLNAELVEQRKRQLQDKAAKCR
ncbi:hypothetical protein Q8A67_009344 [Cirrhinus molitorella]|uniref:Tyrosine specific protein phosphatases domain-containing protein n=1 Tax=Cirrhinus molitorella TaxID=172907 RepID=A0AA88Q1L6_9TELE|nr:hypothetical protein Q8A67_009344 [Cirrhinus molitorella]